MAAGPSPAIIHAILGHFTERTNCYAAIIPLRSVQVFPPSGPVPPAPPSALHISTVSHDRLPLKVGGTSQQSQQIYSTHSSFLHIDLYLYIEKSAVMNFNLYRECDSAHSSSSCCLV